MKYRFHQNFIKRIIDDLFSEEKQIKKDRSKEYHFVSIDTRKPENLHKIAAKMLHDFQKKHVDNTVQLFKSIEIKRARDYQSYFPEFESDTTQKEYYFKLQRWIDCLKKMNEPSADNRTTKQMKPSKLTYLLQLYYEKGCKPLTKPQVEKLADEKEISKAALVNKWNDLKADSYRHKVNVNNAKEFIKSYKTLMQIFKNKNPKAFQDVEIHYKQLKENYPDLTY